MMNRRHTAEAATLPRFTQQLIWVLAGFSLAVLPHVTDLSQWIAAMAGLGVALRLIIELRNWPLPPKWLRIAIALLVMLGVLATYRTLNGLQAGTAFLVIMGAMKLLETRNTRDLTVVIFVAYFLLFAGFLYNQSLLRLPWMLGTAWLLTVTLMRTHQTTPMTIGEATSLTGRMLLQALPLAVALFLLFPRLPGQFWAVPARGGATSGLSDTLSPGDVSELSLSDATAFRVKFDGQPPPPSQRYWRGPVLHDFDGRTWRRSQGFYPQQPITATGPAYSYRVTLEPHNRRWVFGLDAVTDWPDERARLTFDRQLLAGAPIAAPTSFTLSSNTGYEFVGALPAGIRNLDTHTGDGNPRSKQMALELMARSGSPAAFVQEILNKFRDEEYFYTLEPPRLEADSVDDFLFNTRRGFCEHFASAFTFLARAAGIPARVVAGYQGGEFNPMGGYLIVRQSDAHAWSEVWLEGRGWVRVDPTAAVAPERIERGMQAALPENEPVPGRLLNQFDTLVTLRLAWDAINTAWNDSVVEFGAGHQRALLDRLGIENADWEALGLGLVVTLAAFFTFLSVWLGWRFRPRRTDPIARSYDRLCQRLARVGLARQPHEGPRDYLRRVAGRRPELAVPLAHISRLYLSLRYEPTSGETELRQLKILLQRLKV